MRFSANTGFLFPDLPFPERIAAAAAAGFDAVEFHDEVQSADRGAVRAALDRAGLPVCSLNMRRDEAFGCAAIPGAERRFAAEMSDAANAAGATGAAAIHVLSGLTDADAAAETLAANLRRALDMTDRVLVIEPLCPAAAPGYFLRDLDRALKVIDRVGDARVRVLFDLYHIHAIHGDWPARLAAVRDHIGHVQAAGLKDRAEPEPAMIAALAASGHNGPVGLEYRPTRDIAATLAALRGAAAQK